MLNTASPLEGGVVYGPPDIFVVDDIVARHTTSLADYAQLMAMLHDLPRGRVTPAECGTMAGYRAHLQAGEPTCADCRRVNADRKAAQQKVHPSPRYARKPRRVASPKPRPEPEPYICGTLRAYKHHLRVGEPTCAACKRVNADRVARGVAGRRTAEAAVPPDEA